MGRNRGKVPSTATCIQQAINKYALASPEDPEGAEVPAADPGCQQRLLSFQMLRKLSNDSAPPPPLPQPSRAQEHRLERCTGPKYINYNQRAEAVGPGPLPPGVSILPRGPGTPTVTCPRRTWICHSILAQPAPLSVCLGSLSS